MPDDRSTTRSGSFTSEEKAAMKERAKELKAAKAGLDGEQDLLAKIADLPPDDRHIAERIHAIVKDVAPSLTARTYYGMPAWAKDGKVLVFFQPKSKFKARYGTLGFNDDARLDEGTLWPTSWGISELTAKGEAEIAALIKKAVG